MERPCAHLPWVETAPCKIRPSQQTAVTGNTAARIERPVASRDGRGLFVPAASAAKQKRKNVTNVIWIAPIGGDQSVRFAMR